MSQLEVRMSSIIKNLPRNGEFLWIIEHFTNCGHRTGEAISTPVFTMISLLDTDWRLHLYPRGKKNEKYLSFYIEYHPDNRIHAVRINFEVIVIARGGTVYRKLKSKSNYMRCGDRLGYSRFCLRKSIMNSKERTLPKDTFTLMCRLELNKFKDIWRESNLEELSNDFRNMLNKGELSDITLTSSGENFKVHRAFICARAPNLASDLGIDKEIFPIRLEVNHIKSPVLKALLLYLYSGKLEITDEFVITDLYKLAEKYDLRQLKSHLFPGPCHSVARTRIEMTEKSILWNIENFRKRDKEDYPIHKFVDLELIHVVLTCSLECGTKSHEYLRVSARLIRRWQMQNTYFWCKISVKGSLHSPLKSQECSRWFNKGCSESSLTLLNLKKNQIFENVIYLPDDVLQLSLKLVASNGNVTSMIETTKCVWTSTIEQDMRFLSLWQLKKDLKNLWNNGNHTNITIHVRDGEDFEVYSAILAMRSPVLYKMLQNGPTENNCNGLHLSDLDLGIAWELIKYAYCGETHVYTFEQYAKLYVAALKYGMISLMKICKDFLISNLTTKSVCEVVILADFHKDEGMFQAGEEYIAENRNEVLDSIEWKNLVSDNPRLGSELLMCLSTRVLSESRSLIDITQL